MDSDLQKNWQASFERRKKKKRKERRLRIIAVMLAVLLAVIVLVGFKCFEKGKQFISGERTLSSEEWSYYASLKNKAKDLEDQQAKIRVYERLLEKFSKGELQGYAKRDSIIWAKSSANLKKEFNKALKDSKYNSIINLVPKFADPDYLPKDFTPLPMGFMPYKLSEQEFQEALKNPAEWIENIPDSTEEQKKDAH